MRYKLFGTHTGLRVSELVLGTGNFGKRATQWITFERGRWLRTVKDVSESFAADE